MRDLGIEMIPAYSPQARGRSERNFGTWQRRLPQELRLRGIRKREEANAFLREQYLGEFNRKFAVRAAQPESVFVPAQGKDLERMFALQHGAGVRAVGRSLAGVLRTALRRNLRQRRG